MTVTGLLKRQQLRGWGWEERKGPAHTLDPYSFNLTPNFQQVKGGWEGMGVGALRFLGVQLENVYVLVFPMKDPNVEFLIRKVNSSGHRFTYNTPN